MSWISRVQKHKSNNKELEVPCPKCGGKILERRSKKGTKFYGCSNYPECDFVSWFEPTEIKCSVVWYIYVKEV